MHAHVSSGNSGILARHHWPFYANLAFGVTTMHDPSNDTETVFAASELIKAGELVAPRLFSTGTILYGAEGSYKAVVNDLEDAMSHLRRMKKVGAFSVKSYNQPRRDVRQQFVEAARELGMLVVGGGSTYLTWHVLDGLGLSFPVAPLSRRVTLIPARSPVHADADRQLRRAERGYYWYQESNVWENGG